VVGLLELDCVPVRDHYLICLTAPLGSESYEALHQLRSLRR
jgi:hypothetical protein